MEPTELAQLVYDRTEIAETLCRYAFGLDHNDADSLASAFTEDASFDFTPAGAKLEIPFTTVSGRDAIVRTLLSILGPLDTSHTISNLQVQVNGDSASVYAYVLAQHYMPGDGPKQGTEYALLMNRYDAHLVRDGDKWRISRVAIDNAWAEGNPMILTALATYRAVRAKSKPRS